LARSWFSVARLPALLAIEVEIASIAAADTNICILSLALCGAAVIRGDRHRRGA